MSAMPGPLTTSQGAGRVGRRCCCCAQPMSGRRACGSSAFMATLVKHTNRRSRLKISGPGRLSRLPGFCFSCWCALRFLMDVQR